MKILSIGNSFSQDAHKWLSQIAKTNGDDVYAVNLYIGGCSLERHWNNFVSNACEYDMELNGEFVKKTSIIEALKSQKWDVITFQQVSDLSGFEESFEPYLDNLATEVKKVCPTSRFLIHQTWAYEIDSTHTAFANYNNEQKQMYKALSAAYSSVAKRHGWEIIPVGDVIQHLRENYKQFDCSNGGISLNRDGFHLSLLYGRYAAALVWYASLFKGADIKTVKFVPEIDNVVADKQLLQLINEAVAHILCK